MLIFRRPVLSSHAWSFYFQRNARAVTSDDFKPPVDLGMPEGIRAILARSLPAWQLGKVSNVSDFSALARRSAAARQDPRFVDVVESFTREELRHGAGLGDWLDRVGLPRRTWAWGETLFRGARQVLPRYSASVSIFVIFEAMGEIYFGAVRRIAPCLRLQAECDRILRDEVRHLQFHCEYLALVRRHYSRLVRLPLLALEGVIFGAIATSIFLAHRDVLIRSGLTPPRFISLAFDKFRFLQTLMDPDRYHFPELDGPRSSEPVRAGL